MEFIGVSENSFKKKKRCQIQKSYIFTMKSIDFVLRDERPQKRPWTGFVLRIVENVMFRERAPKVRATSIDERRPPRRQWGSAAEDAALKGESLF